MTPLVFNSSSHGNIDKLLLFIIIGTYRLTKNIFRKLSCKLWIMSKSLTKSGRSETFVYVFYLTTPTMSCTGKQQAALRKLHIIYPGRSVRQPGWALTLSPLISWGETNNMGLNPFMLNNCQAQVLGQSPTRCEDGVGSQDVPLVFPGQSLTMILPSVLGARSINTGSVLLIFWKASLGASL